MLECESINGIHLNNNTGLEDRTLELMVTAILLSALHKLIIRMKGEKTFLQINVTYRKLQIGDFK